MEKGSQNQENKTQPQHENRYLSDRDRDVFLTLLNSDEEPNEALKKAAQDYRACKYDVDKG